MKEEKTRPSKTYELGPGDAEDLNRRFNYHAPKSDQPDRYMFLREKARNMAYEIAVFCPPSREKSLALTKVEEAVMWANAAIARNE